MGFRRSLDHRSVDATLLSPTVAEFYKSDLQRDNESRSNLVSLDSMTGRRFDFGIPNCLCGSVLLARLMWLARPQTDARSIDESGRIGH